MDTGWKNPGTISEASDGAISWTNPNNALSSNDSYATCPLTQNCSKFLIGKNFGLNIPSGSTINGILVRVELKSNDVSNCFIHAIRPVKSNDIDWDYKFVGSDDPENPISETEQFIEYGSSSNNISYTLSDVNGSGFGLAFSWFTNSVTEKNVSVDVLQVKVYYTEGSSSNTSSMLQMF